MPIEEETIPMMVITNAFFQPFPCMAQMTMNAKRTNDAFPGVFTTMRLYGIGEIKINNNTPIVPPIAEAKDAWPIAMAPFPCRINW
jgi:hypothetical protein